MAEYLKENLFKKTNLTKILEFVNEMDLNSDSMICEVDILNFLKKYHHFNQQFYPSLSFNLTRTAYSVRNYKQKGTITLNSKALYPVTPFSHEKIDKILIQLRNKLDVLKITFQDFWNLLDTDRDGFLSYDEFCVNIDKIIEFSQSAKDGIFAYIDKTHVGLIDF